MAFSPRRFAVPSAGLRPSTRRRGSALLALALAGVAAFGSTGVAMADPISDINAQIASTQSQLDALDAQAAVVGEQYNGAMFALSQAQDKVNAANAAAAAAEVQLQAARTRLSAFSAAAYRGDGINKVAALLTGNNGPQTMLDKAGELERISTSQHQALDETQAALKAQKAAQQTAQVALGAQQKAVAEAEGRKKALEADSAHAQQLLNSLQQKQAQLVAQAQAAAAAAAAAQQAAAQAALAAAQQRQADLASQSAARSASTSAVSTLPTRGGSVPVSSGGTTTAPSGGNAAQTALNWARAEMGKPYVYGAAGPDTFDCSGLTQFIYAKAGVSLSHYTGAQWNQGTHIARSALQPGDLVFFGSDLHHVGIYVGGDQMIDAPHTGAVVRQEAMWGDYAGAVRPS
ncbi:MAG: hypothetical protein JWM67_1628 [Mycobacterium sp.]|nr:hypothetical protein [Mycobacterium sp.]